MVSAKGTSKEKAETLILIRSEFIDASIKHFSASFLHIRICTTRKGPNNLKVHYYNSTAMRLVNSVQY